MGFWVVSRHADCLAMLRDRRVSSDTINRARRFPPAHQHDNPMAVGPAGDAAVPVP